MLKCLTDILGALTGLLVVSPVLVICMLLILVIDRQNPFFIQTRLGKHKRLFKIIKLRTMKNGQVTGLGKMLRRTGLDELPQLLNILFLQMSFVGPRPLTPADVERLGWGDAYHERRWQARPGITGLAQLSPVCHKKMSWFLDQKYSACSGFFFDLKILVSSVAVLFVGKKRAVQWMHINRKNERTR